ncbi:MAG: ABC transporter permease [Chitinophagaceae bacterium]|nr:MAG: ABC transporter permease [Chitinophagaceae bacterium]
MLYKLFSVVQKEFLLLKRDAGGVIILFVMPLVLIITVTLIQDTTFQKVNNTKISILLVDLDTGRVSEAIKMNMDQSGAFHVITKFNGKAITEVQAKESIFKGEYKLAVVLPKDLSADLQLKINQNVEKIVDNMGIANLFRQKQEFREVLNKEIRLYFDPAVQMSFRSGVMNVVEKMVAQIETESIYATFQDQLGDKDSALKQKDFISFKEIMPEAKGHEIAPNAVQHNVSAWTLFAIFFIVVPLSINIVKEKNQGTFIRLRVSPVPASIVLAGKTLTYLVICMIQFYLMLGVAVFVFPYLGLPALNIAGNLGLMSTVALCAGSAAIGLGILLGTVAKTQEQSAPFGATLVIILAAIGGVWVPVFAMPGIMQAIARASPMNWGLDAFYDVLLRQGTLWDILPEAGLLIFFFTLTLSIALIYEKKKSRL